MRDERVERYAALLVDHSVRVQPGWQVVVNGSPLARPLLEALAREIARRGAYALLRVVFRQWGPPLELAWVEEASNGLIRELAPLERATIEQMDARITVMAPENARDGSQLSTERLALVDAAFEPLFERTFSGEVPAVMCQFPCPALAQDAGMTLAEYEDVLFGACLVDWEALGRELEAVKARFDAADDVRIVAPGTDLRFSLSGRTGRIGDGRINVPDGEVFYSPVEDSAEGTIAFDVPSVYLGHEVRGAELTLEGGRVVRASADMGEDFLLATLDTDPGAGVIGEFGIGCNPGIERPMLNPLFDEKIAGTVHLALGRGYPIVGGTNESAVHWDLVKDLRRGGELWCDGELIQRDGRWL